MVVLTGQQKSKAVIFNYSFFYAASYGWTYRTYCNNISSGIMFRTDLSVFFPLHKKNLPAENTTAAERSGRTGKHRAQEVRQQVRGKIPGLPCVYLCYP